MAPEAATMADPAALAPPSIGGGALHGAVILIGEPGADPAVAMRASFREDGASNVIWRRTMKGVEEAIDAGGIAVAQIDVALPGGDVIELARRIRFGEIGDLRTTSSCRSFASCSATTAAARRSRLRCSKASAVFVEFALAKMVDIVVKLTSFVSSLASLMKS